MIRFFLHFFFMLTIFFTMGCGVKPQAPVAVVQSSHHINYLKEVKPILDARCVVCHSCYNAPCQLKLSSFEGVERGASKMGVYDTRLEPVRPTRLFVDAMNEAQWRERDFFSVRTNTAAGSFNDSLLIQLIQAKIDHPEVVGEYRPETEVWSCPKDAQEVAEYFDEKGAHRGMPYGFPALSDAEFDVLKRWIEQGANGPTPQEQQQLITPSEEAAKQIARWEHFFNMPDPKHRLSARYIYEHIYLAHLYFKGIEGEYYELVRSKTPAPEAIAIIDTVRPYDDPRVDTFYYRFRKIHSTIVHKTHMVFKLDDAYLNRLQAQFIETPWMETPHHVGYSAKRSANPFLTYAQIPPAIRYQFLLDNAHFIVMTFIRGPVCRGQVALASIHDHFWVFFQDPMYDLSLQRPSFLIEQAGNLTLPIETGSDYALYKVFTDAYLERYKNYFHHKSKLYDEVYPKGIGMEGIWQGERPQDAPMLSVYRHFDSASVHKGALGGLPRTMWVIDYPHFERIYYALVAGYDVFGNVSHQANIRRYMDFLRFEGELNFIAYMPKNKQMEMFKAWSKGDSEVESIKNWWQRDTAVTFQSDTPKQEFAERIIKERLHHDIGITFDAINYFHEGETAPSLPARYETMRDYVTGFRAMTAPGTGFIRYIVDSDVNDLYLRIIMPDGNSTVVSLVINRYHDNVSSMLHPDKTLDPSKDTLDFHPFFIGSYPNVFLVARYDELPEFFDLVVNYKPNDYYKALIKKFGISRDHPRFWETYDWFQKRFTEDDPIHSGLFDLNRYYHSAW
ncbi:MAG: fatty acid cis/trans isomerase [Campylobacterales bacterium]|nr:fatty acid cis/trans isomerase [Campylobacterales bacterium]